MLDFIDLDSDSRCARSTDRVQAQPGRAELLIRLAGSDMTARRERGPPGGPVLPRERRDRRSRAARASRGEVLMPRRSEPSGGRPINGDASSGGPGATGPAEDNSNQAPAQGRPDQGSGQGRKAVSAQTRQHHSGLAQIESRSTTEYGRARRSTRSASKLFAELIRDACDAAARLAAGWTDPLPPLVVIADGQGGYVLADGRHRYEARRQLGAGFDLVQAHVYSANGRITGSTSPTSWRSPSRQSQPSR